MKSNERKRVPSTHLPFLFSIGEQLQAFFSVYQILPEDLGSEINQTSGFHNYRDCFCLVCVATVTRPFPQIVNRRFHYKHSTATLVGLLVKFLMYVHANPLVFLAMNKTRNLGKRPRECLSYFSNFIELSPRSTYLCSHLIDSKRTS